MRCFAFRLEFYTLKKNRFAAQLVAGLLLAVATLGLTACANIIYHEPAFPYAGRTIPPSGLLQRVLASYTINGSQGGLQILDGLRDRRNNVQNTIQSFPISGFSAGIPFKIINFPEQQRGYVLSQTDGALGSVDYGKESGLGTVATFGAGSPSAAVAPDGSRIAGTIPQAGVLEVIAGGVTYPLNLPNVDKVVINPGNSIILAMVRNSNTLYRVIKLPTTSTVTAPPFAVDCQPLQVPVYCVVPVGNTNSAGVAGAAYDRPVDAYFSLDGNTVDILDCGPECSGSKAGITVLQAGPLQIDEVPTSDPLASPAPLASLPVANPVAIPGGVTTALSDGINLYLAGQQLQTSGAYAGLFAGNLTVMPLNTYVPGTPVSISDGTHTRMLFADNNTLWIGSSQCASGVRAATAAQQLATQKFTTQAGNYNCLTRIDLGTQAATIVPSVVQSSVTSTPAVQVGYPNTDGNLYYYGNLTGICWVQGFGKVYSAYGGQIHAFNTADGSEINNSLITLQGTVLDVAYMDATTNAAN